MTMNCEDARPMIELYADGELELSRSVELERHLESCPDCARAMEEARSLTKAVRGSGVYDEVPRGLTQRVQSAVLREAGLSETRTVSVRREPPKIAWWRPVAIGALALIILSVFAWRWVPNVQRPAEQNTLLAQEVLDSHVRSLMADHLYDVPSTDQHTVKPWFDGKVDFAPPVVDLTTDGFELAGGRLDYIDGRPVATVVYRRRKHVINLFMWPEDKVAPVSATMRNGYNLLHWQSGGLEYWAASDLNVEEMREFVSLVQAKVGPR
jgi:anti-sigma factor RsiW